MFKFICIFCVFFVLTQGFIWRNRLPFDNDAGGKLADVGNFSYLVYIRFHEEDVCSGVILNERTILTSSYCLIIVDTDELQIVPVAIDEMELNVTYGVSNFHIYAEYNIFHGFALIRLDKNLEMEELNLTYVNLPNKEYENGTIAISVGWGARENGSRTEFLRSGTVELISHTDCAGENYSYGDRVDDSLICAGNVGNSKGVCQNDVGGPIMIGQDLVGIASWTDDCSDMLTPGVYVDIFKMQSKIKEFASAL